MAVRWGRAQKGAAGQQYAIVVGMVGVVALSAVGSVGGTVLSLFDQVSLTVNRLAPAVSKLGDSDIVVNQTRIPGECVAVPVKSEGNTPVSGISEVAVTGDYQPGTCPVNSCVGATIDGGSECFVHVQGTRTANGPLAGSIRVTAARNASATVTLTGMASGLVPAGLELTPGSAAAMNVAGPAQPSYGNPVGFTLSNPGDHAAGPLLVSISSGAAAFEIQSTSCGASLGAGQSCSIAVRPVASANGTLTGNLRAAAGPLSADATLSGSASGFSLAPGLASFSHPTRTANFTAAWSGGIGNGSCEIKLGAISIITVGCDSGSGTYNFGSHGPGSGWQGSAITLVKAGTSEVLLTLGTLNCASNANTVYTPDGEDNDCDGIWDEHDSTSVEVGPLDTFTLGPCSGTELYLKLGDRERYCQGYDSRYVVESYTTSTAVNGRTCSWTGSNWAGATTTSGTKVDILKCGLPRYN